MTNLDKLIEDVETGNRPWREPGDTDMTCAGLILAAFDGSLDAAKSLHEAVLPGWIYLIWSQIASVSMSDHEDPRWWNVMHNGNPARAWLIAILKAYRDMQND